METEAEIWRQIAAGCSNAAIAKMMRHLAGANFMAEGEKRAYCNEAARRLDELDQRYKDLTKLIEMARSDLRSY